MRQLLFRFLMRQVLPASQGHSTRIVKGFHHMRSTTLAPGSHKLFLGTLGILPILGLAFAVHAQSVTWQILPFPTESNWPGPRGAPAVTNGNVVTLDGQPVRTVETFTPPITISYDMMLQARATSDGYLSLRFTPPTQTTADPLPATQVFTIYRNGGQDVLRIDQDTSSGGPTVWGEVPFAVSAQTNYHVVHQRRSLFDPFDGHRAIYKFPTGSGVMATRRHLASE
jgi:hypothetical protein